MTDSSEELKPCPFCSCSMHVSSNRDWHRLEGEHADECPLNGMELIEPATDDGLTALVDAWNTRHSIKEELIAEIGKLYFYEGDCLKRAVLFKSEMEEAIERIVK